jgi:hypothetical protein
MITLINVPRDNLRLFEAFTEIRQDELTHDLRVQRATGRGQPPRFGLPWHVVLFKPGSGMMVSYPVTLDHQVSNDVSPL